MGERLAIAVLLCALVLWVMTGVVLLLAAIGQVTIADAGARAAMTGIFAVVGAVGIFVSLVFLINKNNGDAQ